MMHQDQDISWMVFEQSDPSAAQFNELLVTKSVRPLQRPNIRQHIPCSGILAAILTGGGGGGAAGRNSAWTRWRSPQSESRLVTGLASSSTAFLNSSHLENSLASPSLLFSWSWFIPSRHL